jgi:ribonuclease J
LRTAQALGKQTLLLGRSLTTHARIAEQLGLLPKPLPVYTSPELAQAVPRNKLLVLASGSQAEPQAALARLAKRSHHHLKLDPGDTVLLSSRIIPGRERAVHSLIDDLERQGVRVLQRFDDPKLHVSGHACREEQRKLIDTVKPRTFVPVHGTFHHLRRHAELAREQGIEDVVLIENGAVLELDENGTRLAEPTETGRVHVQAGTPLDDVVLRDRTLLSQVGIVMITLHVDSAGVLRDPPRVLTRGVLWEDREQALLSKVSGDVRRALERLPLPAADEALRDLACRVARNLLRDELGFRPLTHCVITGRDE